MDWLDAHRIEVLKWPPQSPDLNLIENVWGFMTNELKHKKYHDRATFAKAIEAAWDAVPPSFIAKLYASMPSRVRAVISAEGGPTRY